MTVTDSETLSSDSTTDSTAKSTASKRKKKFSPKVRTGCDNCKKRRIKCDERKPECLRCTKSGIQCSGYTIPEPKIFQPAAVPPTAQSRFSIIDARNLMKDTEFPFTRPINVNGLLMLNESYSSLHNLRPSSSPYRTTEDKSAFGFWLSWTAPMLAAYGPNGDFWRFLVPQFTFNSLPIRNLLFAAVTVDEKWLNTVQRKRSHCAGQALVYYTSALKDIASGKTSKVESLVASLMAWTIEAMLFDYRSGLIHLKGARRILEEVEAEALQSGNHNTYDLVHNSLREALGLCEGYNTIMLDSKPQLRDLKNNPCLRQDGGFLTLRAIRGHLSRRLTYYRQGVPDVPQFIRFLKAWENADRAYRYAGSEAQILKETNHLLFNIAAALLPEDQVGEFSYNNNQNTIDYVFIRIQDALKERFRLSRSEQEMMDETLAVVLMHLFDLFPDRVGSVKHRELLTSIATEYPQLFSKTTVLGNFLDSEEEDVATRQPGVNPDELFGMLVDYETGLLGRCG